MKNLFKRLGAMLMALVMIMTMLPVSVLAAEGPTVTMNLAAITDGSKDNDSVSTLKTTVLSKTFSVNETFYVPVILSDMAEFNAFNLQFEYNKDALEFVGTATKFSQEVEVDGETMTSTWGKTLTAGKDLVINKEEAIVTWATDSGVTISENSYGYLFFAQFKVIAQSPTGAETITVKSSVEGTDGVRMTGVTYSSFNYTTNGTVSVEKATTTDPDVGGGSETTEPSFELYYTLPHTDGDDAFKDIQLKTGADDVNTVTATVYVKSNQNITLQAYDIYFTHDDLLTYDSETMDGAAYKDGVDHTYVAETGDAVTHIQLVADAGKHVDLTANEAVSLGTIVFEVSKNAPYGEDLEITLASWDDEDKTGTNVAVAESNATEGNKKSYYPTIIQTVDGVTHSGVEVMNTYTVQFDANGGEFGTDWDSDIDWLTDGDGNKTYPYQTKQYKKDLTLTTKVPTKTGYSFQGWSTTSGEDNEVTYPVGAENKYTTDANTTLYAVWKQDTVAVTFDANGQGTAPATQYIVPGKTATEPTALTAEGYNFGGWYTEAECTNQYDFNTPVTENITLYAKWTLKTYTVTYDDGVDTEIAVPDDATKTHGVELPLSFDVGARTGYTFLGWSETEGATTADYTETGTNVYATNAATILYAVWSANTYEVKYYPNGGTGSMDNSTHTYGVAKKLTANAFKKTGYTFAGWATSIDGAAVYTDEKEVTNLANTQGAVVELFAVWTANTYTVHFDAGGGTGSIADQIFTYDKAQDLTYITDQIKNEGYTFAGWKDIEGNTYTNGENVINLTDVNGATITLTAQWTTNYVIDTSYDATQGKVTTTPQTAPENQKVTVEVTAVAGYNIGTVSYYKTADKDNDDKQLVPIEKDGDGNYSFDMPAYDVTVVATFNGIPYEIQYDKNDNAATGTMDNTDAVYGTATKLRENAFAKTGYTFAGWATSATGDVVYADQAEVSKLSNNGNVAILYAKWTPNNYTIKYEKADDVTYVAGVGDDKTVTYIEKVTMPNATQVTKVGYTLTDWNDGTTTHKPGAEVSGLTAVPNGIVTLTPVWAENTYDITYKQEEGVDYGAITDKVDVPYTKEVTLPTAAEVTKEGYTLTSWTDGTNEYNPGDKVSKLTATPNGAVTLIPVWTAIDYTVEVGTLSNGTVTIESGENYVTKKEDAHVDDNIVLNVAPANGYKIDEVSYTPENGEKKVITANDGVYSFTMPADDVTVNASFSAITYTVTYDPNNGGEQSEASYTILTGLTAAAAPTNGLYVFAGWEVTEADGSWKAGSTLNAGQIVTDCYGNVTLTAQWTFMTHVIEDYKYADSNYVMLRVADDLGDAANEYKFDGKSMYYTTDSNYKINSADAGVFYTLIEKSHIDGKVLKSASESLLTVGSINGTTRATIDYTSGDINADGVVNIADANVVYQMVQYTGSYYAGTLEIHQRLAADMDRATENTENRGSDNDVHVIINIINGVPNT